MLLVITITLVDLNNEMQLNTKHWRDNQQPDSCHVISILSNKAYSFWFAHYLW